MFGTAEGTIDHTLERASQAGIREIGEICERSARDSQRLLELVRDAIDRGDPERHGYGSPTAWVAHFYRCDFGRARQLVETAEALRVLPALEEKLSDGELTLDQVAAAAPIATPESDAEIARAAVGMAPKQIAREARRIEPPRVVDDQELRKRRAFRMAWTPDGRELMLSGQLPLEQGVVFEQAIRAAAKRQRAAEKKDGIILGWQQSTADALVALVAHSGGGEDAGPRRSQATLIVHLSPDEPPLLEGAGTISPETAERLTCDAGRFAIKLDGRDLKSARIGRCASFVQLRALHKRAGGHCQYPGCTATRELQAHHLIHEARGGHCELANLILLCSRHHDLLHDHHIRTTGTGEKPVFTDQSGRAITANQPHAPPG